jgi:hypothetical protein
MSSSQFLELKAKGLFTFSNPLSDAVPIGSFASVSNIVVDRNEIIEPRRGFTQYGNTFGDGTDRVKQLINYKDRILRHVLTSLQYDLNGTFLPFTGDSVSDTGLRIKSIEANGNLYLATLGGIKKLSARSASDFPNISIQDAGGVKALDLAAMPNYSTAGFLLPNSKAAYRIVWGTKDLNENLILGAPSSRTVVYNLSTTDSAIVDLEFSIPSEITSTTYFYQVYRTGVFQGDIKPSVVEPVDPGDEMYLVFEETLTAGDIVAGVINVQDTTPEDFRKSGALLYTNPTSGEGIESANEKPPFAKDICLYKNYTFYANTSTLQRLNLAFLSVTGIVDNSSVFEVSDDTHTNTYTFQGSIETYTANFTGSLSTDFYNGVAGPAKYFTLDSSSDERSYYVWFSQSVNDEDPLLTGKLGIKIEILNTDTLSQIIDKAANGINLVTTDFNISRASDILTIACSNNGFVTASPTETIAAPFTISKDGLGTGQDASANKIFLPRVPTGTENGPTTSQQLEQVARSLVNVLNDQDDIVNSYYTSGFNDVPGQVLFEQQDTVGPQFYLTSDVGTQFQPNLPSSGTTVASTNEVSPNRIFYSKLQQPEAVPIGNYIDVGPRDREIKRIIALRESLFIFKEDGIYRLSGDSAPFIVAPFDFSAQVLAPDTAVVLNNQIYALSTQGVIQITDTGVNVMSRPIENLILSVTRQNFNYKIAAFGVAYETDRSFLLYLPSNANDVVATQCLRYNTFTNSWCKWNVTNTAGIVNFADDKLYLGAGDTNLVEKERKELTRKDHADRQYELQILLNGVNQTVLSLNSVALVAVGDVLIQKQYLTAAQFNRLLDKLDRDIQVSDDDYISLEYSSGQNMRSKLIDLANKMDLDPGIIYTQFLSDIDSYTYNVASMTVSLSQTVITTTVPHDILVNRFINVGAAGTFQVVAVTANTLTINTILLATPTVIQTDVNDFRDMQACYNIMTNVLNTDSGAFFTNYPTSTGDAEFEVVILSIDKLTNSVTVKYPEIFLFGDITLYKAIASQVIWNPAYFGDPSMFKQIREGSMIFENANFSKATLSYSTDLSPAFESIVFEGPGLSVGDWGYFDFGSINWGGIAAPIPLRTLIPRNKQRCRFINVKFDHKVAFEKYAIYGLSLTSRPYSLRAYR